jgi:hypothetical protein
MFSAIHKNVDERVTHLARRAERAGVVSIGEDRTAAAKGAVDRPRDANREPAQSTAERLRVVGFDQKMEMVVLHSEVNDPEPAVGGRDQGAPHGREDPRGPQATDGLARAQRDVYRVGGDVRGPAAVRDAGAAARSGLTARASATPTPGGRRRERKLQRTPHLDLAIIAR